MDSDRTRISDRTPAVLTSFRTLPDEDANGQNGVIDSLTPKSGDGLEENVDLERHHSPVRDAERSSWTPSDPYLVQVTRVETYIDDEEDTTGVQERSGWRGHLRGTNTLQKMTFSLFSSTNI